jgi:hypothetical protein
MLICNDPAATLTLAVCSDGRRRNVEASPIFRAVGDNDRGHTAAETGPVQKSALATFRVSLA